MMPIFIGCAVFGTVGAAAQATSGSKAKSNAATAFMATPGGRNDPGWMRTRRPSFADAPERNALRRSEAASVVARHFDGRDQLLARGGRRRGQDALDALARQVRREQLHE